MWTSIRSTFQALAFPDFRRLWIGALTAFLGFFMSDVVQAVVAFELTGRNRSVGVVVFGRGLAMLTLGLLGGAVADRLPKRRILLAGQTVTATVFLGLALLMMSGAMSVAWLTLAAFITGLVFAFLGPTRQAYVPELVPEESRGNAVALNQVALNASRIGGPALAGTTIASIWIGVSGAFLVMAALYLLAVLYQYRLPEPPTDRRGRERGLFADVAEGLAYVRANRRLRRLVLSFVLTVVLAFPYVILLPGLVEHQLQRDVEVVSLLFSVSALGGLFASLLVAPMADRPRATAIYTASILGLGLSLVGLSRVQSLGAAVVLIVLIGMTGAGVTTLNGALIVREAEPRLLGRVMSLAMLAFAAFGVFGLPIGYLADAVGEGSALLLMGIAVTVLAIVFGAGPRRSYREVTAEPPAALSKQA